MRSKVLLAPGFWLLAPPLSPCVVAEAGGSHHTAALDGVSLHYVTAGEGPLVLLLHGFPEHWYCWRHQLGALAAAGFRAVAMDMRGYNLSSKPAGVEPYRIEHLSGDVDRLLSHLGASRATVVGHDWGGMVAWSFAMRFPDRVSRLVVLNAPHPSRMRRALATWQQLLRSWYIFFFQLPWIPEAAIRAWDFALLRRILRDGPVRRDAMQAEDVDRYVEGMKQPGALTATINYYRANFRGGLSNRPRIRRAISSPVLIIWGSQDRHLGRELAEPDPDWVANFRLARLDEASHWVQEDCPQKVNELLLAFLRETPEQS